MSTRQHVAPKSGGGWGVWRSGASRATRIFPTRRDAVAFARRLAKKESGEMYIHRRDGIVLAHDSYADVPASGKR